MTDATYHAKYTQIWDATRDKIARNDIHVDPAPEEGKNRWGVSTIIRPILPDSVWQELTQIQTIAGSDHCYYTAKNVHITLRTNEAYVQNPDAKQPNYDAYAQAFRDVWQQHFQNADHSIRLRGMIGVPTYLLLCGYPNFDLADLRKRYHARLQDLDALPPGPEQHNGETRDTCHASLAMWAGPLQSPEKVAQTIDALREQDLGHVTEYDVDVVAYTRTPHRVDIHRLHHLLKVA